MDAGRARSLRVAAELAQVTRAAARAVVADELVPSGDLTDADVVALRAAAVARTVLFSGERQPANEARYVRTREREVADQARRIAQDTPVNADACLLVFPDRVRACGDSGSLITSVIEAHRLAEPYLVLPAGAWALEILDRLAKIDAEAEAEAARRKARAEGRAATKPADSNDAAGARTGEEEVSVGS